MLLEREGLLEALAVRLSAAADGDGSLVLVAGEAGAGKTSLVRAFNETAKGDALLIQGACDPLTTPRPLSPLHDFAADADAGLDDLTLADRSPFEIFEAVLDRLRHTMRPIVMVIEDVHWADEGTLDFMRFVGRRVGETKSMVVCTYRDDEVGGEHPLRPVLGQLIPLGSTHRLVVPSLSQDAVAALAHDTDVDPVELHRRSGGNAFYVTEVIAARSAVPPTVQDAVLARVARLDPAARRAVEAVSIGPRSMEIERASALMAVPIEAIDRAVQGGILIGDGVSVRFRHELARAAVEEAIPPGRRLEMHRRMIGLLEEDEVRDPARLAHHAIQAAAADLVVTYAPEAAGDAVRRGARREAVAFYRAALEHHEELGDELTAELRVRLAYELRLFEQVSEAEAELRLAIAYLETVDQPEKLADALGILQACLWNQRRFEEGWAGIESALALLRPLGPSEMLGTTLYRAAHHHMLARHRQAALDHIEEAGAVAGEIGSDDVEWLVGMMTGCIQLVVGDPEAGIDLLRSAIQDAEAMANPHFTAIGLSMLGSGGGEARRYGEAIPALERGITQGLATDEDYTVAYNRAWLARIAFEQGRWDDSVALAELAARTTMQREGIAFLTAMSALGRVRVRRGDPGGLSLLEEMTRLGRAHELQHAWNAVCGRAEHLWLTGRAEAGLDELVPAYEKALETDSEWARGEIGFWMWRVGAIDGPPPRAAEPFALQMGGLWREAADVWREIGCPYEVAHALADGDSEAMIEAVAIFDSMGAKPAADMVRSRLREAGVERIPRGPSQRTRSNPAGLTGRQMEVLAMIGQGMGNVEIASRLFLSKKTVEHHVSAIYSKLGVDTRSKAIRIAAELGGDSQT